MNQYLLSMYQPDGEVPRPDVPLTPDGRTLIEVMRDVNLVSQEMKATGAWVFAGGLHPPSAATVVRLEKDGQIGMTDGPFTEGKEHIGGFTVVKASDLDAALEWAGKLARATTLPIEVRSFQHSGANG